MDPVSAFLTALVTTVVFLASAAVMGRRRRIKPHVLLVGCAVLSLGVAIVFALRVGELYDLEAAGAITPIHLNLARITTATYLWPLATGPLAAKGKVSPRVHRTGAYVAITLTLAATVTGALMLMGAEPLDV
jgi:hypothetical protein